MTQSANSENPKKWCVQLTTKHRLSDDRILHRMAKTLACAGYRSSFIGTGEEGGDVNSVTVESALPVPRGNPFSRVATLWGALSWGLKRKPHSIQIHDPDLLVIGPLFRLFGTKVVYDVHDDYEASLLDRLKRIGMLGQLIAKLWWWFEYTLAHCFNGIVVADRHLAAKFCKFSPVVLGNFPRLDFTNPADLTAKSETFNIIYVGGVTEARGVGKVLDALDLLPHKDIRFHVIGNCRSAKLKQRMNTNPRAVFHGRVDWTRLGEHYQHAHLGVALYQPLESFIYCPGENAVKVLEYMAAGIPVLTSNFPGLRAFVADNQYGLVTDPTSPDAIAKKINELYNDSELRSTLGQNGRRAFETEYNWEKHEHKLIELYRRVLG